MNLLNIKSIKKASGFTIVELLVVIVVIGILASITVVSYTGVTSRANTAANQSNANSIKSAVASLYALNSSYPAWTTDSAGTLALINAGVAKVPTGVVLQNTPAVAGSNIGYEVIGTAGVCISYWDYSAATPGARYVGVGNVTIPSTQLTCS